MFEREQQSITTQICRYCSQHDLPDPGEIKWMPIPFSGEWGISTSFFQLAAQQARLEKERGGAGFNVAQRAQEIAETVRAALELPAGFAHAETVKGYLNLYYSTAEFTRRVVDTVLEQGSAFGRGAPKGKRILVEFSQPNTHKAFHVGHLRNVVLGDAVCNILEMAGYDVVRANNINDSG